MAALEHDLEAKVLAALARADAASAAGAAAVSRAAQLETRLAAATHAGQRLQRFASHAFREQLGRTANGLHSNAAHAAHATPCLVDGKRRPGRWELRAGELVTLELGAAADDDTPPPQRGSRPRMALRDEAGAGTTAGSSASFTAYFRAQQLCASDEAWAAVEAAFARPLPLCARVSHSASTRRLAVAAAALHLPHLGARLRRP